MEHAIIPPMMDVTHIKRKWLDVAYADQSPTQKIDIYLPEQGDGPFPVIMAVHGGAWLFGDKRDVQHLPMMKGLERGYAVICVNYRLSQEAIFPNQIFDVKAALRFVKANATHYHLNDNKIGFWGGSAGGHLSSLLGTSAHVKELEDLTMGHAGQNCEIQAVVDWCGPCEDFIQMDIEFKKSGMGVADHSLDGSPESLLLGKKITAIPELVKFASPMTYVTKDAPYFLIQHGELDHIVPIEQSIRFAAQLEKVAGLEKVTFEILKDIHHHGDPGFETEINVNRVYAFLDKHLKQ
jgi:acetyl esterase/lipase